MAFSSIADNKPLKYRRHIRHKSRKKYVAHGIVIAAITFTATLFISRIFDSHGTYLQVKKRDSGINEVKELSRNCTPSAVESFPSGFFTKEQRQRGAVIINFLVSFYIFGALAVICDDYFVPSLEGITEGLNISPDVAGATFMAAGSSAPELFTSIISVFITGGEIGIGTILGSAVFNLLFIIGICGLLAGMVIRLLFWPMFRDSLCYIISIVALVIVISDETIQWYESLILLILYVGYILLMYFNESLKNINNSILNINGHMPPSENSSLIENREGNDITLMNDKNLQCIEVNCSNGISMHTSSNSLQINETDESKEQDHILAVPDGVVCRCIWLIAFPIYLSFYLTIPDCRRVRWKSWYMITFLNSVIYIGGLSYVLVWMVSIIGDTFSIDDSIMGLTLLAAGTSIPDAMASVLAARDGFGGMAISNSIGSNIFDILLCLGLPWFIQTFIVDFNGTIGIPSSSLLFTAIMLLATMFVTLLVFYLRGGQLNKYTGSLFIIAYIIFLTICILHDTNIIGNGTAIITCPT
ncbi:sodium/potassium/calcium exchanger 3-like isoform X2 [Anneissia japonica]|nr:sodium/potassium/calcium exchanger 3-like isoform X2 [Anneissia japonica]